MGFNSAFKGLIVITVTKITLIIITITTTVQ